MTLWNLDKMQSGSVAGFDAALPNNYQTRLRELGFAKNAAVTCLKKTPFGGPKIYQIGDSVFSLAKELASSVIIEDKQ